MRSSSRAPHRRSLAGKPGSRERALGRWAIEVLPAFAVGLVLLPRVIANGTWDRPATIDLQVYFTAAHHLLDGKPIYDVGLTGGGLQFIYPPIAAVLALPLTLFSYHAVQLGWTLLNVAAQQGVLRRCGLPGGWRLGLFGAVVLATFEPLRTTLGYGQVNTVVMWLVVADLLPDPYRPRRLPRGILIGLAASIKLTPLLFVAFVLIMGLWKVAAWAVATTATLAVAGFAIGPAQAWWFWTHLGEYRASGTAYVGNQALSGVAARVVTRSDVGAPGVLVGMAIALVACAWAAWQYWHGKRVLAVGLVGCASVLASPLGWTHHYVWGVLILAALVGPVAARPAPWLRWALWPWVVWVAVCPPLALLPYARLVELTYLPWQQVVANIGPLWLSGVIVIGGVKMVIETFAQDRSAAAMPAPARPSR